MHNPKFKVTVGTETFESRRAMSFEVPRLENGWDTATIVMDNNPNLYPTPATSGAVAKIEVKEASDAAWTTLLNGTLRFPTYSFGDSKQIILKCLGAGYPLGAMYCAEEYGSQSRNPTLDTFKEILTDATSGVIPAYVNHVLGSTDDSGHAITTDDGGSTVEDITGTVPYQIYPGKPVNKCVDDLCDYITALKAGAAGPHWIVDPSGIFRAKTIGGTQTNWTKYYGNSATAATLTEGVDFTDGNFEPMGKEANYIIYYGAWRRPSSGDLWTKNAASLWGTNVAYDVIISDDTVKYIVGEESIRATYDQYDDLATLHYPLGKDAAWDFSYFSTYNTPSLNFYFLSDHASADVQVHLVDSAGNYVYYTLDIPDADTWYHFSIPTPQFKVISGDTVWRVGAGVMDWSDVDYVQFYLANGGNVDGYYCVDGLHFGGATICRVAREKYPGEGGTLGQAANPVVMKEIRDDQGKDDSLTAADDSGLAAQLAYSELLRLQKTCTVGSFSTPMIRDLMPGQYLYIGGVDWRVTKVTQTMNPAPVGFRSKIEVTTDVTNSHARSRYEDANKMYAAIRPEYQDRQATNQKTGDLDIRIARLEKAY